MKKKRVNKTREEIISDLKNNQKFQEKMKFTKEVFYPALCKATKSIDDAQQNLNIINSIMMEKFLGFMKDKKFSELKMEEMLSPEDEKYEAIKDMLALFNDKSVFETKEFFEGMKQEINLFVNEENKERALSDLHTKWLDEIK